MSSLPLFTVLILDLGDVLFTWSPDTKTRVARRLLRDMLSSETWKAYERGRLSQEDCYSRLAADFSIHVDDIASALQKAQESLRVNTQLADLIRELKASDDALQVYAMSNISIPDYNVVRQMPLDWAIFDEVFPSGLIGERKPDKAIYEHLVAKTGIDPRYAVFVDDKPENVSTARSLGMHGVVFDSLDKVSTTLRELFLGPLRGAYRYLRANAGALDSVTDNGHICKENFAQLMILEVLGDESLIAYSEAPFIWNFFRGKPLFYDTFPDDFDTTALALTVLERDPDLLAKVMDEMLHWTDDRGLLFMYHDKTRRRIDPYVNINILVLFFRHRRGRELARALDWVIEVLDQRGYMNGSRYYTSPDTYLYFMSRLLACPFDESLQDRAMPIFVDRVKERVGVPGEPIDLAMRVIVCCRLGINDEVDLKKLIAAQLCDGGWSEGWLYKYGISGVKIGNRGLTTALAVHAIQLASK
ncbi:Haloacid dehalogenase-like hydrolase-domain-containing protein [Rhodofomes roseus]|nr:Haloacid dehalogenase-like hydrolase-domain-containing protein [Rhodofomes roseus]KAH9833010.1 Haloacid dehalogenase-like hydrolase-domain-containing protein [Rhodofomes roseus]